MKRMLQFLLAFTLALPFIAFAGCLDGYTAYESASDFDKALAQAKQEGKGVMLVLSLPNCPPCDYVMRTLGRKELREVYQKNFVGVYAIWHEMSTAERDRLWIPHRPLVAPSFVFLDRYFKIFCNTIVRGQQQPTTLGVCRRRT